MALQGISSLFFSKSTLFVILLVTTTLFPTITVHAGKNNTNPSSSTKRYWKTFPTIGPDHVCTGNRVLASHARGGFPNDVESFDVEFDSDVKWIVAAGDDASLGAPRFVVTTADGLAFVVEGDPDAKEEVRIAPNSNDASFPLFDFSTRSSVIAWNVLPLDVAGISPEQPPLVMTHVEANATVTSIMQLPSWANVSSLSHPLPAFSCSGPSGDGEKCHLFVYIDTKYDIVLYDSARDVELDRISGLNALPDARIVMAPRDSFQATHGDSSLLAVYAGATRYSHCVLGDCKEGSSLVLFRVVQGDDDAYSFTIQRTTNLPSNTVFEGLSPMFIQDGAILMTTVANSSNGAWLRAYDVSTGDILSESSFIGWGWRHMLFYNNFAPIEDGNDDPFFSMVDVLTPHVRKQLQFFDISSSGEDADGSAMMTLRASTAKYTTHDIGWRYLDTAVSADFNGDGINEAVLLDDKLESLVSFQLVDSASSVEMEQVWSLPLVGKLTTNIAAMPFRKEISTNSVNNTQIIIEGRGLALAAASGTKLRVWMSMAPLESNDSSIEDNSSNDGFQPIISNNKEGDGSLSAMTQIGLGILISAVFVTLVLICD